MDKDFEKYNVFGYDGGFGTCFGGDKYFEELEVDFGDFGGVFNWPGVCANCLCAVHLCGASGPGGQGPDGHFVGSCEQVVGPCGHLVGSCEQGPGGQCVLGPQCGHGPQGGQCVFGLQGGHKQVMGRSGPRLGKNQVGKDFPNPTPPADICLHQKVILDLPLCFASPPCNKNRGIRRRVSETKTLCTEQLSQFVFTTPPPEQPPPACRAADPPPAAANMVIQVGIGGFGKVLGDLQCRDMCSAVCDLQDRKSPEVLDLDSRLNEDSVVCAKDFALDLVIFLRSNPSSQNVDLLQHDLVFAKGMRVASPIQTSCLDCHFLSLTCRCFAVPLGSVQLASGGTFGTCSGNAGIVPSLPLQKKAVDDNPAEKSGILSTGKVDFEVHRVVVEKPALQL